MSQIVWDRPEDRKFETGVEKGTLYIGARGTEIVPWNGLVNVRDGYTEGDVEPRYQDGIKTHNYVPQHEFETEIEAITYPDEFEKCLGLGSTFNGVLVDEQARVPFSMSYQTRIGDPIHGDSLGVKIHLIYNAIATPSQAVRTTQAENVELTTFNWTIKTAPVLIPGYQPSSHFVLDSTRVGPLMFRHLTNTLYGTPTVSPRLLYPDDIVRLADEWQILYPSNSTYPSTDTFPGGP